MDPVVFMHLFVILILSNLFIIDVADTLETLVAAQG